MTRVETSASYTPSIKLSTNNLSLFLYTLSNFGEYSNHSCTMMAENAYLHSDPCWKSNNFIIGAQSIRSKLSLASGYWKVEICRLTRSQNSDFPLGNFPLAGSFRKRSILEVVVGSTLSELEVVCSSLSTVIMTPATSRYTTTITTSIFFFLQWRNNSKNRQIAFSSVSYWPSW